MEIHTDFFHNRKFAGPFYSLQKNVFPSIDLSWAHDEGYLGLTTPFGLFDQGRALSIATTTRAPVLLDGTELEMIQVGTVATDPLLRHRGYSAQLLNTVLERFGQFPLFLYANDDVVDFYPRFGFRKVMESVYHVKLAPAAENRFRQLDPSAGEDRATMEKTFDTRCSLSSLFWVTQFSQLAKWYCRQFYNKMLWFDGDSNTLMVATTDNDALLIYDIVTERLDHAFFQKLSWPGVAEAVCFFVPDQFDGTFTRQPDQTPNSHLYIRGEFPDDGSYIFPQLAHT